MAGAEVRNMIVFEHFQGCYTVISSTGQNGEQQEEISPSSARKTYIRYLRKVEKSLKKIFLAVRVVE